MKTSLLTLDPGQKVKLRDVDADAKGPYDTKDETIPVRDDLHARLDKLQERLYAESKQSLLLVFQAMDSGGKDGAAKNLLTGVNPAGVQVTSFKVPNSHELAHDFLWRIHQATPPRGYIGVWNRSHYEDVLVARVHKLVPEKVWRARYEQINSFEKMLSANGTTILKFYLHISKDEQRERLQKRLDNPDKYWKFNPGDLKERELWNDYMAAYEDALRECSTKAAPWNVVPANHKWARDLAILQKVVATLDEMNPQYPQATFDPKTVKIES